MNEKKNTGMSMTTKAAIESNDPGCGRKYDPNLCLMRHRAAKIKEERGQEHGPCAYCLIILNPQTEKEKPMEVKNKCKNIGCVREKTTKSGFCNGCYQKDWKERKATGIPAPKITVIKTHKIDDAKPVESVAAEVKPWHAQAVVESEPIAPNNDPIIEQRKCNQIGLQTKPEPDEIIRRALRYYGDRHQICKMAEEASGLSAAILRYVSPDFTGKNPLPGLIEELADVEIMCKQMRLIFGDAPIDEMVKQKLARLEKRMGDNLAK